MMRLLYTILLYLATPFILMRLLWRSLRQSAYRKRISERFALFPKLNAQKSIWIHAVSVGETHAALPLIKSILTTFPNYEVVVTNTTPTGSNEIQKFSYKKISYFYTPFDLPGVIKRFLKKTQPSLCIIMETELWPNLLHYTHKNQIPILLANGRLSDRSVAGYLRIPSLCKQMMECISTVAAQTKADGDKFLRLGLAPNKLLISGNIKFDTTTSADVIENANALRSHWQQRPTWIAASTHEGEEKIILDAHKKILTQFKNALLILVPRHPERFNKIAHLCEEEKFTPVRRSENKLPNEETQIYLGDTMGELRLLYAASDIAFVGGSLAPIGGHNPIEPALLRLPVITGPHTQNFTYVNQLLESCGALKQIDNADDLAEWVIQLMNSPSLRQQYGEEAYRACITEAGALNKLNKWIESYLLQ